MSQGSQEKKDAGFLWGDWWDSAAKAWGFSPASSQEAEKNTTECWQASVDMWKTLLSSWTSPDAMRATQGPSAMADATLSNARAICDGCLNLHQEWLKWAGKFGETGQLTGLDNIQSEMLKVWMDFHEKEIQPLLRIPQVGLTRVYQEKLNQLLDKFNLYQAVVAEFQCMLALPMEKSMRVMQEKLDALRQKGESIEDFKDYYSIWIKVLEDHYMNLFKSMEYRESLGKLLKETATFRMTGHELLMDLLQFLPIPTNKDMDEVYKDLYMTKKMLKEMKKRLETLESATQKDQEVVA